MVQRRFKLLSNDQTVLNEGVIPQIEGIPTLITWHDMFFVLNPETVLQAVEDQSRPLDYWRIDQVWKSEKTGG